MVMKENSGEKAHGTDSNICDMGYDMGYNMCDDMCDNMRYGMW